MAVTELSDMNFDKVLKSSKKPVLVDFFAEWCNPCKALSPVIDELSEENHNAVFAKLDVDRSEETARKYGIMSVPTLIVFEGGNVRASLTGIASKRQINKLISEVRGGADV